MDTRQKLWLLASFAIGQCVYSFLIFLTESTTVNNISLFSFYPVFCLNQKCVCEEMLKCQNVHIPKLCNKKLCEGSNIPFLIFTIGFSNRAALYSWSVAGIPAVLYTTGDKLFCKNVTRRFQMEIKWVE